MCYVFFDVLCRLQEKKVEMISTILYLAYCMRIGMKHDPQVELS